MSDHDGDPGRDDDDGREDSMPLEDGDLKGSSSTQVRKAQNRIAQREFRLRKQVRDLEARVEVLSGDKEERVELMTLLVRNLLKENKDLRGMVKSMAVFVGEGLGSCLPRLGLSSDQLDAILNRSDTDTAYEAFVNLKASREQKTGNPGIVIGQPRRKPSGSPATTKRKHDALDGDESSTVGDGRSEDRRGGESSADGTKSTAANAEQREGSGPSRGEKKPTRADSLSRADGYRSRPTPRRPNANDEEYDFLFPDLETWFGDGSPSTAPIALNASGDGENDRDRSYTSTPRHGYARHLVSSDGVLPSPPAQQSTVGADDGGFGLTLPESTSGKSFARDSATFHSLAGPRGNSAAFFDPANYASSHQSVLQSNINVSKPDRQNLPSDPAAPSTTTGPSADINDLNHDLFSGPGMTAAEVAERRRQQAQLEKTIEEADPADRKMETMQLITYHLNNFRVNHDYHLPPSLRPTVVQRTMPHEHAIDGIIFPSIRDRMILLRGRYDLVEMFHAMINEFTLHGDDVLDHRNYEVSDKFVEDYGALVDDQVISIANKWRAQRGAPPLVKPAQPQGSEQHGTDGYRISRALERQ